MLRKQATAIIWLVSELIFARSTVRKLGSTADRVAKPKVTKTFELATASLLIRLGRSKRLEEIWQTCPSYRGITNRKLN
jgi:hypothetical protein